MHLLLLVVSFLFMCASVSAQCINSTSEPWFVRRFLSGDTQVLLFTHDDCLAGWGGNVIRLEIGR